MHLSMLSSSVIPRDYTRKLVPERSRVSYAKQLLAVYSDLAVDFTGISAPYEAPENPEIHIDTSTTDVAESVRIITDYLTAKGYISQ